ncbi:hypothetical protein OG900_22505 [Streptomyces sp. NBC_00433]
MLEVLGWASLAVGTFIGADAYHSMRSGKAIHGWAAVPVELVIMAAALAGGRWAVRQGRRHRAPLLGSLETLADGEEIVLFLRAFVDDAGFASIPSGPAKGGPWAATSRTEEQQIARATAPFGRLVALGRPSDRLPQAGAARHYASDHDWQNQVLTAMDRAGLILLACGPGRSLRWEVEQVVARNQPERLVLIGVRDDRQYASFKAATLDLFPQPLPEAPADPERHGEMSRTYTRSVIWFDADWTPHPVGLGDQDPEVRVDKLIKPHAWVESTFPLAIRPVFQRAARAVPGLPARRIDQRPRPATAAVAILALMLSTALILGLVHLKGEETLTMSLFVYLPVSVLLYRVWRGGHVAVLLVKLLGGLFGALCLSLPVLFSRIHESSGGARTTFVLLAGAGLLISTFLLHREVVHEWVASQALVTPRAPK